MKLHYIFLICGALVFVACQGNEELTAPGGEETLELVTPTVADTRTVLQSNGTSVAWEDGDAIAVYDYSAPKHEFTAQVTDKFTRFRGNITAKRSSFLAVYPYELAAENMVNQKVILTLPQEQTAVAGSFGPDLNLSIAKGERNLDGSPSQIRFRNLCQLFKLSVPEYAKDRITRIEFTANTSICGQMEIDYSQYSPAVSISQEGNKTITLLPPTGSSTFAQGTYYMVLAPATIEGFTLTLTDTQAKTYTQHSSTVLGGNQGVICNLGNVDLVDVPVITPQHAYVDDVLHGTNLTLTAPVPDKEWTAVVKNAGGTTVRTATATGTLTSGYTDQDWHYLPKGSYTVEYTYTTANGKTMNATTSFQITEDPQFGFTFNAASSYTYYMGDGVTKDVDKANSMSANQVTGIVCNATGILPSILGDPRYGFELNNDFGGEIAETAENQATFKDITISNLGNTTLSASLTFDGVTKSASKNVYITGLPYTANPPTTADWTGDAHNWTYDRYEAPAVRLHDHTITKTFNLPSNVNVNVTHDVDVHTCTVGTTYSLKAGGNTIFSVTHDGGAGQNECHNHTETSPGTLTSGNATVSCSNSYGNSWSSAIFHGTHALIRKIVVNYR